MFRGKCSNRLIIKTHCWCLRAFYNTQTKTYHNLLRINGKIDIHTHNIQILMTEIYKYLNKINPPFTCRHFSKHFSTTGKRSWKLNLKLSYETQSLHVFFFVFVFEALLKDFLSHLPILLTLWFRYLQTRIK